MTRIGEKSLITLRWEIMNWLQHASTSTSQVPFSYLNGGVLPLGANRAGTSTEEYPTTSFACDDEDDLLNECVSRIRLVQFQKDTEEPMGITLKVGKPNHSFSLFLPFKSTNHSCCFNVKKLQALVKHTIFSFSFIMQTWTKVLIILKYGANFDI